MYKRQIFTLDTISLRQLMDIMVLHLKLTDSQQDTQPSQLVQDSGDKMHRVLTSPLLVINLTLLLVVLTIKLVVVWPLHLVD